MSDSSSTRDTVVAQLDALSAPDAPCSTDSPRNTTLLYATSVRRRVFRKTVIDRYLDSAPTPPREGRSALITAGPPGAGKSTLLSQQIADLQDYRRLDADEVKDYLIRQALDDGIYDDLLEHRLADGHPIAPRELAALVHHESTALIDQIRRICTDRQENVLIEGTLRWPTTAGGYWPNSPPPTTRACASSGSRCRSRSRTNKRCSARPPPRRG